MSQVTHRRTALPPSSRDTPQALPAVGAWLLGGVLAAGLGLGTLAALVTLLWITSPYPDSGADGALHIAADLWLLAHGAQLVRSETLSGGPAPMGLTPLLLSALPVWLLCRAAQHGLEERDVRGDGRSAVAVVGWVCAGYLLIAGLAVIYTADGPLRVNVLGAALQLPLVVVSVTAVAAWVDSGRPPPAVPEGRLRRKGAHGGKPESAALRALRTVAEALTRDRILTALRATGLAVGVLCAGGALLVAGAMIRHADVAQSAFPQLTTSWSGRIAVLLLAVTLIPNAAVWGAAYGLGPGFTLGAGSTVGPLAAGGYPQLPHFPLFAGLPSEGPGGPVTWTMAGLLPLVAGVASGWCVARASVPVPGSSDGAAGRRGTAGTAGLAAVGAGLAMALLAAFGGGPMGTGALADFGPSWWLTGLAALGWTALLGVPAALTVRAWRLRPSAAPAPAPVAEPATAATGPDRSAKPGKPGKAAKAGKSAKRGGLFRRAKGGEPVTGTGGASGAEGLDDWHTTAARRTRWAALKKSSGDLMAEFDPRDD